MDKKIGDYTVKELRQICQITAPNREGETLTGLFCRIFSIYLTKLFLYTKITPNQITVLGTLVFLVSAFTQFGSYWLTFLGPALYFLSIVIDGADGEVARFKRIKSKFGGSYMEPVSHDIQYGLFFPIISFALFMKGFPVYFLIFGFCASVAKLLYRLLQIRFWDAVYVGTVREGKEEQNLIYRNQPLMKKIFYWFNRNFLSFTGILFPFLLAVVLKRMDIFLIFYFISYSLTFLALLAKHSLIIMKSQ